MTNKTIELVSIELINFKGATHFKLEPKGADVDVYGKNGAGKTTIYDAFTWCLFHKDSKEKTEFDFEPRGNDVDELAGVSVSLILSVNGTERKFTKELNKKKNVKSGGINKEPVYYVDDLKLNTKKAYDEKVAELIDKDKFKYLTNGSYFMESLKASERREILFEYFGSKTDEEIIESNKELSPLLKYLGTSSLEDENKKLLQKKQSLEKSIKEVNPQIKGIRKALPDITEINQEALNTEKSELFISIDKEEQDLLALKNGSAVTDKKNFIKEKESQLRAAETDYSSNQKKKTADLEDKRSELRIAYREVENRLTDANEEEFATALEIEKNQEYLKRLETELTNYGKQLDKIEESTYEHEAFIPQSFDEHQLACPTCKRAWEFEDQEEIRENFESSEKERLAKYEQEKAAAIKAFNDHNDAEFERINQLGKEASEEIEVITEKTNDLKNVLSAKKETVAKITQELEQAKLEGEKVAAQIKDITDNLVPFVESEEYANIQAEIAELEKEITELNKSIESSVEAKQQIISGFKAEVRAIDEKLAVVNEYNRQQSVINQLIEEEKQMSAEKGEIEAELLLFENFFITKVSLLEENINKNFKFIQFKLFDYYDNGNLDESICEPELNDVRYRDMSNGEQIKAKIDICDTLMRAEGIYVPLFLDNAEGLTETFETDTQVIALNASKEDNSLRVNVQNIKSEVAA
ncbi:AAA family ATPase [Vagococcus fluvialis]|jgi:DNA repair exonuclease SbcCD ATPase subunit|uniref:ATP-binding protein n=1 Tax=Vagococcus fluvialis TaxID=2738 RepID=UPI001A8C0FC4|nr:ATP-binding protein [Vagococcus fluvialis]MBO0430460.1 AAA family ATPase [Vagococcus fluvialis]